MTLQLVKDLPAEIAAMPVKINRLQRGGMRPVPHPQPEMPDNVLTAEMFAEALRRMRNL